MHTEPAVTRMPRPPSATHERHQRLWPASRWTRLCMLLGLLLAVAYLGYTGLARTAFWDDEAHVAIIAKNFLASGHLTAWDGRNLHAYRNGIVLKSTLEQLGPPLDSIVVAGSFWLFGASTWAGRVPFVVAGLLALVVFARLLRHDFGGHRPAWLYALCTLGLSPVFLLNIRQCRYYALAILLSLLAFYAYRRCLVNARWPAFISLAVFSALLFYSNYFLCVAFLLALGVHHSVFYPRRFGWREWRKAALAVSLFIVAILPYLSKATHYPDLGHEGAWLLRRGTLLWWNLRELNLLGCLPWPLAIGLLYGLWKDRTDTHATRSGWQWLTLALSYVGFIALFSPQPTTVPTIADVRYLMIAVPFLAGVVGLFLQMVHQRMPLVAVTVVSLMVTSNVFTLTPWNREFRWLLPAFMQEIHRPYPTSYEAVATYLNTHAAPDDLVLTYPEYTHPPLLFYAGDRVRICCLLNQDTPLPVSTLERLRAPLLIERHFPTWIVAFGNHPDVWKLLQYFSRPHPHGGKQVRFRYPLHQVLDVYWGATHRPELPWHRFGPKTDFNRLAEAVYLFKRTEVTHDEPDALRADF